MQEQEDFLHGCGLPAAWAGQAQWCILETGFGLGLNFLATWQAWQNDPARPAMLHFLSVEAKPVSAADVLQAAKCHPELQPLALQLAAQWWGLLPGFHRLVFEGGHVLLTLGIGEAKHLLRDQSTGFAADSVFLNGFGSLCRPDAWDVATFKAIARCVRRGARFAAWTAVQSVQDNLRQTGFMGQKVPGTAPQRDSLQGEYNPPWTVKKRVTAGAMQPTSWPAESARTAIVIGAGLAGAAVASSLARRGWKVVVLEAGPIAASGASSLPAGVMAVHVSRGDASGLSGLSRSGVRATLGQAEALLTAGQDWQCSGLLQRTDLESSDTPPSTADFYGKGSPSIFQADWLRPATPEECAASGGAELPQALWHTRAGWIKPASLVKAWLNSPNIRLQTFSRVSRFLPNGTGWQALDCSGQTLAEGNLVVLAAGIDSKVLSQAAPGTLSLPLQPIRGQVSWGFFPVDAAEPMPFLPVFPVNGLGSLISGVPMPEGTANPALQKLAWLVGASYARDSSSLQVSAADHAENFTRLQTLVPSAAKELAHFFNPAAQSDLHSWTGVRCASPNRLPLVGPLVHSPGTAPQWWVCTAMGSRGLTMAALCAELLAAKLHGEPLAVGRRLADTMFIC